MFVRNTENYDLSTVQIVQGSFSSSDNYGRSDKDSTCDKRVLLNFSCHDVESYLWITESQHEKTDVRFDSFISIAESSVVDSVIFPIETTASGNENTDSTRHHERDQVSSKLAREFIALRDLWEEEIKYQSSATNIIEHPAYQEVIKRGELMLPFIIKEIRNEKPLWFHALREITGLMPDVDGDHSIRNLKKAWLDWYAQAGNTVESH